MKSTVENLESTKVKVSVEVPYEELKKDMDAAYKEISNQVNVPGFRRGKVPPRIIDQRFGRVTVIEQAINAAMPRLYSGAVEEHELRPVAQPEIDVEEIPNTTGKPGGELKFTAEILVIPPFEIPSLDGLEIEVDPLEVTDKDVDAELEELQTRFATLKTIKRKAKKGDFATLDLVAKIGDEEVDSVSDVSYEIGSKSMLDGMDKALTGMKADEETTFTTTLKGGEHEGEEADVTLKVKAMKTRELPKADDDFAQMVSEFDTIDELRDDLKNTAQSRKQGEQALQARDRLLDKLIDGAKIEIPKQVVEEELPKLVGEDAKPADKTKGRKQIRRQLSEQALLQDLAAAREVRVGQQEVFEYIMQMAQMHGLEPAQLMQSQEQVSALVGDLTRTKALALTLGMVTVKDTNGDEVDLSEFTKDPLEEQEKADEEAAQTAETEAADNASDGDEKDAAAESEDESAEEK
ncbi:trigger factor [Gleimia hominis]|uniref:Trigger factor n=1 Tax=Gleimia hominis TaxID=595468 RepID=A0ABU3IAQ1_9ACTO|nr:trigger factor [Gleimia hominis]MDT3767454.1 trigger factor [Gleimia hominis]